MTYAEFVVWIVQDGVTAAQRDYAAVRLAGALAGFDAVLDCDTPPELGALLAFARNKQIALLDEAPDDDARIFAQTFVAEVEWVCNCVSAFLLNEGSQPLIKPSSRGILKCAELLGAAPRGVPIEPQWFLDSPAAGTPDCLCSFCGRPIDLTPVIVLRVWNGPLELRACARDACTAAFLSGTADVAGTRPA